MSLASWLHHVFRHPRCPSYLLLHAQTADWLRHARVLSGKMSRYFDGTHAGVTRTRGESGNVARWAGKWLEAISSSVPLSNVERDPSLTRELSSALESILEHGRWHGMKVLEI